VPLNDDFAGFRDFSFEHCVLAQPPHQHAGPAVNEPLGQTFVQRVGQSVLDAPGDALPVLGIGEPVRTVCRKSPGPDVGDTVRKRIDIAIGAVRLRHLAGEPFVGDFTLPHQKSIEGGDEFCMIGGSNLPVIGNLTGIP